MDKRINPRDVPSAYLGDTTLQIFRFLFNHCKPAVSPEEATLQDIRPLPASLFFWDPVLRFQRSKAYFTTLGAMITRLEAGFSVLPGR